MQNVLCYIKIIGTRSGKKYVISNEIDDEKSRFSSSRSYKTCKNWCADWLQIVGLFHQIISKNMCFFTRIITRQMRYWLYKIFARARTSPLIF